MRYVPIQSLLQTIFADSEGGKDKRRLEKAHETVTRTSTKDRKSYIDKKGTPNWSPLKNRFTAELRNKCWYTEAQLVGASLTIDHYRPKCDYWFLAFKAENYRVACPYANSPKHNVEHGCGGGKGDKFPLFDEKKKGKGPYSIKHEKPIILDPCNENDCKLIAFQTDGRPVLHPDYVDDHDAKKRVEDSKILLNLDHPDFNSQREQLRKAIDRDVKSHEISVAYPDHQEDLRNSLAQRISKTAPFSIAARQYLSAHRHLEWVSDLLNQN
jgi:hypothetical protein